MLISKGHECHLFIKGKQRPLSPPASYAMLHDPGGTDWPAGSILVAPFSKDRREISYGPAEEYFGDEPMGGSISLPPRDLDKWSELGPVTKIEYTRLRPHGLSTKYEGDYFHVFDGSEGLLSLLTFFFKAPEPTLFRRGRLYRMELPYWASLDDRGFIWP